MAETTYYKSGVIRVTSNALSTRFKDEPLNPDQSIIVGRDPLWMAAIIAVGLLLFASRFGDLLYLYEQALLVGLGFLIAFAGYATATLHIGQYMRERIVLVAPIWKVNAVRCAIAKAKSDQLNSLSHTIIVDDAAD